jgi:hypothetical protein
MVSSLNSEKLSVLSLFLQCMVFCVTITSVVFCLRALLLEEKENSLRLKQHVHKGMVVCSVLLAVNAALFVVLSLYNTMRFQEKLHGWIASHKDDLSSDALDEEYLPKWFGYDDIWLETVLVRISYVFQEAGLTIFIRLRKSS